MMAAPNVVDVIALCYHVGKQVIAIIETWQGAEEELRSRTIRVETAWHRVKSQVDFLQRIEPVIDDHLYANFDDQLCEFYKCLTVALQKLELGGQKERRRSYNLAKLGRRAKAEYIWRKSTLDALIWDLECWMKSFDPSWFLAIKIASPVIDKELREMSKTAGHTGNPAKGPPDVAKDPIAAALNMRSVLLPNGGQQKSLGLPECAMQTSSIRYCEGRLGRLTGDYKWYLIDSISAGLAPDVSALKKDVRQLAVKLSVADPLAFGLLSCKGVMPVKVRDQSTGQATDEISAFHMVFRIPQGMNSLLSLRDMLISSQCSMSVTQRVRIACELATSISYVHTFGFVHKNVRPESILCFENLQEKRSHTFLIGFDSFRSADGATNYHGDMEWERNLYRHPLRQGAWPADKYNMRNDIYSLGVCLLEIGLCESFVEYKLDGTSHVARPCPGPWYDGFQNWLSSSPDVLSHEMPWKVKDFFIDLAGGKLPARMGDKYTSVVLGCLLCLDAQESSDVVKRDAKNEAAMDVAVQFVEQTVLALTEILT